MSDAEQLRELRQELAKVGDLDQGAQELVNKAQRLLTVAEIRVSDE